MSRNFLKIVITIGIYSDRLVAKMENVTGVPGMNSTLIVALNATLGSQDSVLYGHIAHVTVEPNKQLEYTTADSYTNATFNASANVIFSHIPRYELPVLVAICIVLSLLILATIVGNVFVISAVCLERSLRGVSNYLILSLAVTDLLVAVLVMPLSLVNEISIHWFLGNIICDMWVSMDVLCCTSSILHLVAISLDRYWGVSNIDYIRRRCAKNIIFMVIVVWIVSIMISIPPLFGWKEPDNDASKQGACMISQDLGYTVFSTIGAFYCPLILMVVLNMKIYVAARSRIRKKNFLGRNKPVPSTFTDMNTTARKSSSGSDISQEGYTAINGSVAATCALNDMNEDSNMQSDEVEHETPQKTGEGPCYLVVPSSSVYKPGFPQNQTNGHSNQNHTRHTSFSKALENNNHKKVRRRDADKKRKDKLEMKRERKAARVLGIITGAFIACWLPFFIFAVVGPFCGAACDLPRELFAFCLWLGYFNSSLNPVIYTIFNPSFRKAFHKILYGRYRLRR